MPSCKDCKFSHRKGHWCEKYRKNTMPYHPSCFDGFELSDDAKKKVFSFPKIIHFKVNAMYVMARALEKMVYDIDLNMKKYKHHFSEDKAKTFARMVAYISKAQEEFDELEKDYTKNLDDKEYSLMNRDAQELVRLVLLFGDKCSRDKENNDNLFKYLRSMTGEEIVKEEDLERFYKTQW